MRRILCAPAFTIELVIMAQSFVLGLYFASPFFFIDSRSSKFTPVLDAMSDTLALYVVASTFVIGSILGVYGRITRQQRMNSSGLFMIMLAHIYTLSIVMMSSGGLGINWLAEACILLMVMLLWGRKRVIVHGEP